VRSTGAQTQKLVKLAAATSLQTETLITLTKWIIGLTIVLGVIAILQLVAAVR
jgi:hypothetical protein